VILLLPGLSEKQWIAGLKERLGCDDLTQLAAALLEKWEAALNDRATAHHPHIKTPAQLGALLTRIPPEEAAACLRDSLQKAMGDAHSIYAAIKSFGVERAATDLFRRAAVLCHLNSRDHEILNVSPAEHTVVRLPSPCGPGDAAIRSQLEDAFHELDTSCLIEDASPRERDITVMRTLVGWPMAIEQSNFALLTAYASCGELNHSPHLFGILPDEQDGQPLQTLTDLAAALRTMET
jgi:hypothetical protein